MKTFYLRILPILLLFGFLIGSSCEKPDPDAQSAEDDARGSYIMADAFAVGNNEAGGGDGGKAYLPDCMTVVRDTEMQTVTITFDNCDYRGAVRNGIINVSYTVPNPDEPRAVSVVITFDNYTIKSVGVEGTITSTFGGTIIKPEIHIVASNMKATFLDSRTITWSSDKIYTFTEGFGDGDISTNVIEMSGTAEGINRKGESYDATYNVVTIDRSCESGYPVSGTVTIISNKGTSVIDYGDGTCDNAIIVTNNGISLPVTLN